MDPGSSIKRAVNFIAKEARQFLLGLWGKEGACDKHLRGFDRSCPLPFLHFFS